METNIYDLLNNLIMVVWILGVLIVWMHYYTKYELKALKVNGYMDLRLKEKQIRAELRKAELDYKLEIKKIKHGE